MSFRSHRSAVVVISASLLVASFARAADAPTAGDKDRQIAELRSQVQKLEARLAALEKQIGPLLAQRAADAGAEQPAARPAAGESSAAQAAVAGGGGPVTAAQREKLVARARQRMRQDSQKHSPEQLREAEELYQVANKNWRTPEAKASLEQMVEKFPAVNRTGCAVLYLAQYSEGDERERLLKQAIDQYGDCFYGNGVQVAAFARLLLGDHYQRGGQPEKAKELFDEIRKKYPDAITHRGESIVAKLPQ